MTLTAIILHCLLLYPVYQILGTIRHELAHAIAALFQGIEVLEVRVFPSRLDGKWYWGFVRVDACPSSWFFGAPYLVNILVAGLGFAVVPFVAGLDAPHAWLAAVILFWASPALDTLYNLCKWWFQDTGDFKRIVE